VTYGKGFIPDPSEDIWTPARRLIGAATPPPRSSLDAFIPGILDQGQTSSCVGHASMCARYTALSAHGTPEPLQSPAWAYKVGLAVDREDVNESLVDAGSQPNQVARGVEEFGTVPFDECPTDEATITNEPTVYQLERASRTRLVGWRRITTRGDERVVDLQRAIVAKTPPMFAIEVDQAFEDWSGAGVIQEMRGPSLGGHMLYLLDYETLSTGEVIFTFANSWGRSWGFGGLGRVGRRFVDRMSSILIPGIRRAA
jgi:hypothetical protein